MDPRKLKVNELKEQLQLVGLSTAGKKEELVARLLEHQKQEDDLLGAPAAPLGSTAEWDGDIDDLAAPVDTTPTPAASAPVPTKVTTPVVSASPVVAQTTTQASGPVAATPVATTSTTVTPVTPAHNIKFATAAPVKDAETLAAELAKRKDRAARFGIPVKEQDKVAERAARFGLSAPAALSKLTGSLTPAPTKSTASSTSSSSSTAKPAVTGKASLPSKPAAPGAKPAVIVPTEVLSKRQERFGVVAPITKSTTPSTSTSTGASKTPNAVSNPQTKSSPKVAAGASPKTIYALDAAEEEKKRKRAAKFGGAPTDADAKKVKV